jgi:hypothetical protein
MRGGCRQLAGFFRQVDLYGVSVNFIAKDARGIRKGSQRRLPLRLAQNFATFAFQFADPVVSVMSF